MVTPLGHPDAAGLCRLMLVRVGFHARPWLLHPVVARSPGLKVRWLAA